MFCRWILLLLVFTSWYGHAKPLLIAAPPEVIALVDPLYQRWFSQAGLEVKFLPCSWTRCQALSQQHVVDGEALRLGEYGENNRQLVRVNVPLTQVAFYGLSLDASVANQSLPQLLHAQKRFACARGNAWCEKAIPPPQLHLLNALTQGIPLLLRDRIDILIVTDHYPPAYIPKEVEGRAIVNTLLRRGSHYLFLTSQHATEAQKLQNAWSNMIKSPAWVSFSAQFIAGQKIIIQMQYPPLKVAG